MQIALKSDFDGPLTARSGHSMRGRFVFMYAVRISAEAIGRLSQGQTVTQVALDMGYRSSCAFIAMFHRSVGAPLSRYLKSGSIDWG